MALKIGIVGTRGIPAKYGGFETFAQELSSLLVENGYQVTVYCEKSNIESLSNNFNGVSLFYLPITKTKNPLVYYLISLWHALKREEVALVAGTGGSPFYFLNILFRKIIITNTDGLESRRAKWSFIKRIFIKLTELLAVKYSTHLIADSGEITKYMVATYGRIVQSRLSTIEYGARINDASDKKVLRKYDLEENDYYLVVSRLEPENNIETIINGYKLTNSQKSLIIVGNINNNRYNESILLKQGKKIRFLGGIYDSNELSVIRHAAFAYIHGHSVGGTNPSLLEALGSSNISICHDNVFNREVTNNEQFYFTKPTDIRNIIEELEGMTENALGEFKRLAKIRVEKYYTWENISSKYSSLFLKLCNNSKMPD